jgi:hypothetical protein
VTRSFNVICIEILRTNLVSLEDAETRVATERTRKLGLVVVRGTQVSLISPQDGVEEIANPFLPVDDDVHVNEG